MIYQSQLRPVAQIDSTGAITQFYLYAEKVNVPSLMVREEAGVDVTYRVVSDHLGSVRLVINANTGVVAQRMAYDEYGVVLEDTNPGFQPFGYAGGLYDHDTGLVRFGARDYDPNLGRWLSKDPIQFDGGFNHFVYVDANPIDTFDLNGLCPCGNASALLDVARADPRDWSKSGDRSEIHGKFGKHENKCNLFVDYQYDVAGFNLPNTGGGFLARRFDYYPPGAGELSKPDYQVAGWPVVSGPAKPGDLLANNGHVGIATGNGTSISASPSGIVENNWGFRVNSDRGGNATSTVIRRCSCGN